MSSIYNSINKVCFKGRELKSFQGVVKDLEVIVTVLS